MSGEAIVRTQHFNGANSSMSQARTNSTKNWKIRQSHDMLKSKEAESPRVLLI